MKQITRFLVLLGLLASIITLIPPQRLFAQSLINSLLNVPVICPCDQHYCTKCASLSIQRNNGAAGSALTVGNGGSLPVTPDADGRVRLSLYMPPRTPDEGLNCITPPPGIVVTINGKTMSTTAAGSSFSFSYVASEIQLPADVKVSTTDGYQYDCVQFKLVCGSPTCLKTCGASHGVQASSPYGFPSGSPLCPSGSCTPGSGVGGNGTGGGGSGGGSGSGGVGGAGSPGSSPGVGISIPVGSSGNGRRPASLVMYLSDLPASRSDMKLLASSDTLASETTVGDVTKLDSVTTDSSIAKLVDGAGSDFSVEIRTPDIGAGAPPNLRKIDFHSDATSLTVTDHDIVHSDSRVFKWTREQLSVNSIKWSFTEGFASGISAGDGLSKVENTKTALDQSTHEERTITKEGGVTISDVKRTYHLFAWGWELIREEVDPDGAKLVSTWSYHGAGAGAGLLATMVRPDGYYETHTYDVVENTYSHTIASPFTDGSTLLEKAIIRDNDNSTETVTEQVGSDFLSKTVTVYGANSRTMKSYMDAGHFLTTSTTYVDPDVDPANGGQPKLVTHPDGTITTYVYAGGGAADLSVTTQTGAASGATVSEGTETVTRISSKGQTLESKSTLFTATEQTITNHSLAVPNSIDVLGRPTQIQYFPFNGGGPPWTIEMSYNCCGIASETDRYGNLTTYTYDDLKRRVSTTQYSGTAHQIVSGMAYNVDQGGGLFADTTSRAGTVIAKSVRNLSGTVSESWGPSPESGALEKLSTRTTTYLNPAGVAAGLPAGIGARTVTAAALTGAVTASQTEDHYLDGRTFQSTGALSPQMRYSYAVNAIGLLNSRSYIDGANLRETSTSQTDWAERTTVQTLGTAATTYAYDDAGASPTGRLLSMADADGVTTLYAYNAKGERTITALDLDDSGTIDYNVDQITKSETVPGSYGGFNVVTSTTQVYATSGNNAATTVSTSHQTPDGLRSWAITPGYSTTSSSVVNAISSSLTVLGGSGGWTETRTGPDGTRSVSNYTAGLLASVEQRDNGAGAGTLIASTAYGYDALNRPITSTDSRTGATTTEYKSVISDVVKSVTPPAGVSQKVSYAYDHRGLTVSTTLPDSTVTNTAYDESGQAVASWGSQTYPTYTTYDYAHRIKTLRTNPTLAGGVPTNAGGSVTTWNYDTDTGWLTSKRDNDDKGATYTHTNAGRLKTRTWARGKHCVYDYVNGRLAATRYFTNNTDNISDTDTPNVGMVYNRLGQRTRMITAAIGGQPGTSIEYTYTAPAFNVSQEAFTIDPDLTFSVDGSGVSVTEGTVEPSIQRVLHRKMDDTLRNAGADLRLTSAANSGLVTGSTLAYSASGRLNTATARLNGADNVFTYGYTANSYGLIASVTGPAHTVTNTWETDRDVLASKSNAKVSDSSVISSIGYTVNAIGQRTNATRTGAATNSTAWDYDAFGQVKEANDSVDTSDRAYLYDAIGNRKKSIEGTTTLPGSDNYTANALNQYTAVPSTTSAPEYDLDGNMTAGPLPIAPDVNATLAWNGENRLISVTPTGDSATYLQDAMGRRVLKAVNHSGVITRTYFFYDGWNLLGEYTGPVHTTGAAPNVTLQRTHAWGKDLSGSAQGAGGVGGLLATCLNSVSGAPTYYPTYDGNGNVTEYLDGSGAVQSHYEYDPFGNDITPAGTAGSLHNSFPFRFSTKYLDAESGMYYYGYRYYDPLTGRWLSRDPLSEPGFRLETATKRKATTKHEAQMYVFVENNSIENWDYLGLDNPGCDLPSWVQPTGRNAACYRRCCAAHDQCYFTRNGTARYGNRRCTAASWALNAGQVVGFIGGSWGGTLLTWACGRHPCTGCNNDVLACFARCASGVNPPTGPEWFCPNGPSAGQYFDDWNKIPADCWESGIKPGNAP